MKSLKTVYPFQCPNDVRDRFSFTFSTKGGQNHLDFSVTACHSCGRKGERNETLGRCKTHDTQLVWDLDTCVMRMQLRFIKSLKQA